MVATAHFIAITCYIGAAALAAAPFARPVGAPLRAVLAALAAGVVAHACALLAVHHGAGELPLTGLGPALSFAGLLLAGMLLVVEALAREVSLTLVAAPFAALATTCANLVGLHPLLEPRGIRGLWLVSHIALGFTGVAALATAGAAGAMYLVERRELKSRRFGPVFRSFPPLETLDRVNHIAAVAAWVGLSLGVTLMVGYSMVYGGGDVAHVAWALGAWVAASALAVGRTVGGWRARRAAIVSSVAIVAVVALYVAFRVSTAERGHFL